MKWDDNCMLLFDVTFSMVASLGKVWSLPWRQVMMLLDPNTMGGFGIHLRDCLLAWIVSRRHTTTHGLHQSWKQTFRTCSFSLCAARLIRKVGMDLSLLMSMLCPFQMFLTLAKTHLDATKPHWAASGQGRWDAYIEERPFVAFLSPKGEADGTCINSTSWVPNTCPFFFSSLTISRVDVFYPDCTSADMNSKKCREGFIILWTGIKTKSIAKVLGNLVSTLYNLSYVLPTIIQK